MNANRFYLLSAGVVVLAFLLREYFVLAAIVPEPFQGDTSAYMLYVQHMLNQGVFSMATDGHPVTPDAFRAPGYPLFLYAFIKPTNGSGWYHRVLQAQVLLGTATVACVIALSRQWMSRGWALTAGILMAFQAHHIVATGIMLTEVLFGLLVIAALLATALAIDRRSMAMALLAGATFGLGYLVNPVIALFPFVVLPLFWREGLAKQGAALLLVSLVAVGGWAARNSLVHATDDDRAAINLVQGSWPIYHSAANNRFRYPEAQRVMDAIAAESATMVRDPSAGLASIRDRFSREPGMFAQWYLSKPYLLWDWEVRIGAGGIYPQTVEKSPLERNPTLRLATTIQRELNPLLFALAVAFAVCALARKTPGASIAALFAIYVTAVHVVLQAEPRYSIPYRSVEILLAVGTLAYLYESLRAPAQTSSVTGDTAGASPRISPDLMKA